MSGERSQQGWSRVKWSRAQQIAEQMTEPFSLIDDEGASTPEKTFSNLRIRDADAALKFASFALSRGDALQWVSTVLTRLAKANEPGSNATEILKSLDAFASGGGDARRRKLLELGEREGFDTAAGHAALAAFFSGGSIAPEGVEFTAPPAGAFQSAVYVTMLLAGQCEDPEDSERALAQILDEFVNIASRAS